MAEQTFAIQTQAPLVQAPGAVRVGQVGIAGGGQERRAPQAYHVPLDTSTTDAIMKIGAAILEPAIQKRQAELFLQGAQRVAQGEALRDIIDEQPWYTKIFGEGASIQGARTVAQTKQVQDFALELYNDMPRLQTMSREEVGKEVNKRMLQFMTGDAVADAVIQQKMVETSGGFFQAHAKANYKWMQSEMQSQVSGLIRSSAATLQAANRQRLEGTLSEEDWKQHQAAAAGALLPIAGQSPESYWAAVEAATVDAMANGNHHFAGIVFGSGVLDNAPDEVRKKLIDARHTYEGRTIEQEGYLMFGAEIGKLQGMAAAGVISPAEIAQKAVQINEAFRMHTGIERDIVSRKDFTSMLKGDYSAMYRRAERNAEAAAKDAAKGLEDLHRLDEIRQHLAVGAGNMIVAAGHKRADVEAVFLGMTDSLQEDWSDLAILNFNNGGFVSSTLQHRMQSALRAASGNGYSGKAFDDAHAMAKQLSDKPGGQAAMMAYLGKEDGAKMLAYDTFVRSGMDKEQAWQMSFGAPLDTSRKSTDKEIAERIKEQVEAEQPGFWAQRFGTPAMNPAGQRILTNVIARNYDVLAGTAIGDDAALKIATDMAKQEVDIVGPFVYPKAPTQPPLSALIGTDDATAGDFLHDLLREDAKAQGVKLELAKSITSDIRMVKDEGVGGVLLPSPFKATKWWDHFTRTQPDVVINRGPDRIDPETRLPFSTYTVNIVSPEGDMARMTYDTRELRRRFKESNYYK